MRKLLRQLLLFLDRRERALCLVILMMMAVGAGLEVLGIGLIVPVIAALAQPVLLQQNMFLHLLYDLLRPSSNESFIVVICIVIICFYIAKNLFLLFVSYVQTSFVFRKAQMLAVQLFEQYLRTPYVLHLQRNSAECMNNVNRVSMVATGVLLPFMMLVSEVAVVVAIYAALLYFIPLLSLILAAICISAFVLCYYPFKGYNYRLGERIHQSGEQIVRLVNYSLNGLKEIKVLNREAYFSEQHRRFQHEDKRCLGVASCVGQIPRFFIEAFMVVVGMGALMITVASGVNTESVLLKFTLLAFAMFRMMPSLSRLQYSLSNIRQNLNSFERIAAELFSDKPAVAAANGEDITLAEAIVLENLSFRYPQAEAPVIRAFSLTIPYKSSVAFTGVTGCGKTTLADLIVGLLPPESGRVLVDGRNIAQNIPSWQKQIGYVPQDIYLVDASIAANVALGIPADSVDAGQVREALRLAQVLDFVEGLPEGVETVVGERGVRLSGGQRQRIGIARALYHNPKVLVLDEATSALDNQTEKAFADALRQLQGKLTIIIIAHRMTTVRDCDRVVQLDGHS